MVLPDIREVEFALFNSYILRTYLKTEKHMIIDGHTYSPHHVLTMVFIRLLLWHGRMDACCTPEPSNLDEFFGSGVWDGWDGRLLRP